MLFTKDPEMRNVNEDKEKNLQFVRNSVLSYKENFSLRDDALIGAIPLLSKEDAFLLPLKDGRDIDVSRFLWKEADQSHLPKRDIDEIFRELSPDPENTTSAFIFLPLVEMDHSSPLFRGNGHFSPDEARTALAGSIFDSRAKYLATSYIVTVFCTLVAQYRHFIYEQLCISNLMPEIFDEEKKHSVAGIERVRQNFMRLDPDISKVIIDDKTYGIFKNMTKESFFPFMIEFYKFALIKIIRSSSLKNLINNKEIFVDQVFSEIDKTVKNDKDADSLKNFFIFHIFSLPGVLRAYKITTGSALINGIKLNAKEIMMNMEQKQ